MTQIQIRMAAAADEAALAELDRRTWAPENSVAPRPGPDSRFFDSYHRPQDFYVAQDQGRVIGFVRLVQPVPLETGAHVRQIQGLAVHPDAQGRGLGRALLRAACEQARDQGARRITLRVLSSNTVAMALYASEGFAVEGRLPAEFLIEGRYVDDVLMGRSLDAGQ